MSLTKDSGLGDGGDMDRFRKTAPWKYYIIDVFSRRCGLADDTLGMIPLRARPHWLLSLEAAHLLALQIPPPFLSLSSPPPPPHDSLHLPNGKHVAGVVIC